jgi:hypothetical protein
MLSSLVLGSFHSPSAVVVDDVSAPIDVLTAFGFLGHIIFQERIHAMRPVQEAFDCRRDLRITFFWTASRQAMALAWSLTKSKTHPGGPLMKKVQQLPRIGNPLGG